MQRTLLFTASLLVAGMVALPAQQASDNPPLYHGTQTHVDGVFVTPVASAPFSATVLIRSEQAMPDGTMVTKTTVNLIGRDTRGRIHNERRSLVPESFRGTPHLTEVHIFDPQTRLNTFYDPMTHIARQRLLAELPKAPNLRTTSNPMVKVENLESTNLEGFAALGYDPGANQRNRRAGDRGGRVLVFGGPAREPAGAAQRSTHGRSDSCSLRHQARGAAAGLLRGSGGVQDRGHDAASGRTSGARCGRDERSYPIMRCTRLVAASTVSGSLPKPSIQCTSGSCRNQVNCRFA